MFITIHLSYCLCRCKVDGLEALYSLSTSKERTIHSEVDRGGGMVTVTTFLSLSHSFIF
jgi:hypothetical protein